MAICWQNFFVKNPPILTYNGATHQERTAFSFSLKSSFRCLALQMFHAPQNLGLQYQPLPLLNEASGTGVQG